MSKIKNLPKHEQPREKLIEKGVENLKDAELMAILLRTGIEGVVVTKSVVLSFKEKGLI